VGEHKGGMIALIPADPDRLVVRGGEPAGEAHLTLVYLGDDVTGWPQAQRDAVERAVAARAASLAPIDARVFAHAVFNPDAHADRDPCAVYLVGDTRELAPLREELSVFAAADQHEPFVPHVTAGYGVPVSRLDYTGPIRFDRIRVAMADTSTDYPLTGTPTTSTKGAVVGTPETTRGDGYTWADASDPFTAGVLLGLAGLDDDEYDEVKAGPPGNTRPSKDPGATKLRDYWVRGPGAKKIRWGTDDDFDRCVRHLRKHVGVRAEGLCNIYHRSALGAAPGKGHKHAAHGAETKSLELWVADPDSPVGWRARTFTWERVSDPGLAAELKQAADIEWAQADAARRGVEAKNRLGKVAAAAAQVLEDLKDGPGVTEDPEAALDRFEGMADTLTAEEAYEEALSEDLDWEMAADGKLVEEDAPEADGTRPPKVGRDDVAEPDAVEVDDVEPEGDDGPPPVDLFADVEDDEEPPPVVSLFDVEPETPADTRR